MSTTIQTNTTSLEEVLETINNLPPSGGGGGGEYNLISVDNGDGTQNLNATTASGGTTLISKTITVNGTYDPADDNADGYNEVTVNVSGGGGVEVPEGTGIVSFDGPDNMFVYYSNFMFLPEDGMFSEITFHHPFETSDAIISGNTYISKIIFDSDLLSGQSLPFMRFVNLNGNCQFKFHWNKGDIQTNFEIWGAAMDEDQLAENFSVEYIPD